MLYFFIYFKNYSLQLEILTGFQISMNKYFHADIIFYKNILIFQHNTSKHFFFQILFITEKL